MRKTAAAAYIRGMTIPTRNRDIGQPGHPTHFAGHTHSEPTESLGAVEAMIEEAKTPTTLIYPSYDDQFSERQIGLYLAGDIGGLEDDIDDAFFDMWYGALEERVDEIIGDADVDDDARDEINDWVRDADDSDISGQLARNTHSQLMRATLGTPQDLAEEIGIGGNTTFNALHPGAEKARSVVLIEALRRYGVEATPEMVEPLSTEGPQFWHEAVTLDVIWYGDIRDAALPDEDATRAVQFTGAHVLLLDSMNGSGYEIEVPGQITVPLTHDSPAFLDSAQSGGHYGWDDTAGVHKPAYKPSDIKTLEPVA